MTTSGDPARLSAALVVEIRLRNAAGEPLPSIARRCGVRERMVNDVCALRVWGHVPTRLGLLRTLEAQG